MFKPVGAIAIASVLILLCGCGGKAPTINESMTKVVQPQAEIIWNVTSRAFNAKGDGLDGSKITAADWAALADAGAKIRDRAQAIADAPHVTVATADETIMGQNASHAGTKQTWDAASVKQVQGLIDANPKLFAQHARVLADAGDKVVKSSATHDAALLYSVSANLDEVCDGCHQPFWGTDEPPPFPGK